MGDVFGQRFFFSSRRRHTSWPRDWSSDVCSSDLIRSYSTVPNTILAKETHVDSCGKAKTMRPHSERFLRVRRLIARSEERRVGKEWGAGGWGERGRKQNVAGNKRSDYTE